MNISFIFRYRIAALVIAIVILVSAAVADCTFKDYQHYILYGSYISHGYGIGLYYPVYMKHGDAIAFFDMDKRKLELIYRTGKKRSIDPSEILKKRILWNIKLITDGGSKILCLHQLDSGIQGDPVSTELYSYDIDTGKSQFLRKFPGLVRAGMYSPDGSKLAIVADSELYYPSSGKAITLGLWIYSVNDDKWVMQFEANKGGIELSNWSGNNSKIYVLTDIWANGFKLRSFESDRNEMKVLMNYVKSSFVSNRAIKVLDSEREIICGEDNGSLVLTNLADNSSQVLTSIKGLSAAKIQVDSSGKYVVAVFYKKDSLEVSKTFRAVSIHPTNQNSLHFQFQDGKDFSEYLWHPNLPRLLVTCWNGRKCEFREYSMDDN